MRIVNLTPHTLNFLTENGSPILSVESSGCARCASTEVATDQSICGVPVVETAFGEISGLPEPAEDTVYVVSRIVADAAKAAGRTDVFSVGRTLRDGSTILGSVNLV